MNAATGTSPSTLPAGFLLRLREQFPKNDESILSTFHQRPPVIRANALLIEPEKLRSRLREEGIGTDEIKELPGSWLVTNADRKKITALPAYQQGLIYLQSIASQLVVKALDPRPGEKILDLCAAPGSKTGQIAIALKKKGELIANELNRGRFFKLKANLDHQQLAHFVQAKNYPGQNYPRFFPEYFDRVLVDAPCSSEARFVTEDPKTSKYWSNHKVKAFARLQKKLLSAAILCAKPGGMVVYSTCTFSPEENELVIDAVLRQHPEIELMAPKWHKKGLPVLLNWKGKDLDSSLGRALRLMPDAFQEGFFIAVLRKRKGLQINESAT